MTKKEILRKVLVIFYWLCLFYVSVKFLPGKADSFTCVCIFICWSILALILILIIVSKIMDKVNAYKTYKSLIKGIEYLQAVQKARYKLYFTGDKEKIEEYSTEIERYGRVMLDVGKNAISSNLLSKKHINNIKKILDQTKEIMTNCRGLE